MAKTTAAGLYIVKRDEDGNVMIFLPQPEGEKKNPVIIYDGKDHALFVRSEEQNIILDYINPDVREILIDAQDVIVIEVDGQDVANSYEVDVRHVEMIPLKWEQYGLKTWDEVSNK